ARGRKSLLSTTPLETDGLRQRYLWRPGPLDWGAGGARTTGFGSHCPIEIGPWRRRSVARRPLGTMMLTVKKIVGIPLCLRSNDYLHRHPHIRDRRVSDREPGIL